MLKSMLKADRWLLVIAVLAFGYAVLGNYVALPGYLRFLERGGTSEAGNAMDWSVVAGAIRTILWMYAFNIGALCLYWRSLSLNNRRYLRHGLVVGFAWLCFWSIPHLPRTSAAFYLIVGTLTMAAIVATYVSTRPSNNPEARRFLFATAVLFFAMATWDVCGLGSTGRILHPDQVVLSRSQALLGTQTTKLMLAFSIAWSCLAFSTFARGASESRP